MRVPENIRKPPELDDEYRLYWSAFIDLLSEARGASKMLPWTAINEYAKHVGLPVDELKIVIWELDHKLREWWKSREPNDDARNQDSH